MFLSVSITIEDELLGYYNKVISQELLEKEVYHDKMLDRIENDENEGEEKILDAICEDDIDLHILELRIKGEKISRHTHENVKHSQEEIAKIIFGDSSKRQIVRTRLKNILKRYNKLFNTNVKKI